MKLQPNHLIPYLDHKIEVMYIPLDVDKPIKAFLTGISIQDGIETTYKGKRKGCSGDLIGWEGHNNVSVMGVKPILRPLSDLTKEEYWKLSGKFENESFGFWHTKNKDGGYFYKEGHSSSLYHKVDNMQFWMVEFLFEHHFDVFGLIPEELAIDKNTLK